MNKYLLYLSLGLIVIISWCGEKNIKEIVFDNYLLTLETKTTTYKDIETPHTWDNENIYKAYVSDNQSGFTNSILITKQVEDTNIPLEKISEINIEKLSKKVQWFTSKWLSQKNIECNSKKITGYIERFTLDALTPESILYINQFFFIDRWLLYIISTSTQDKKDNNELNDFINTITCIK